MEKKEKDYKEGRFEFTIFINDHIICKRNFNIMNFIDNSMESEEFKFTVDNIVRLIDEDLKSKSRVYTWHFFNPMQGQDLPEFSEPLLNPWECTFKIVISDNHRDVITRIWDGYAYPKYVRDKVDLTNKNVRIVNKDGNVFTYEKESFFKTNEGRLSIELETLKGMILDKQDILYQVQKMICETCGAADFASRKTANLTMSDVYRNIEFVRDEDGNIQLGKDGKPKTRQNGSIKYSYSLAAINRKNTSSWGKIVAEKTKEYQKTLY